MGNYEGFDKPIEKCAVVGITDPEDSAIPTIEALRALQHRGQEASGVASQHDGNGILTIHSEPGLVKDVYAKKKVIDNLKGNYSIGHNRYSTNGARNEHLQPVFDKSIGFAFAHNGNLPVTTQLEKKLQKHNVITSALNDSELMARTIATYIRNGKDLPDAIIKAYKNFKGAFSCVAMHNNQIVAFRDSNGIRPLALGDHGSKSWAVTSETCALDAIGAEYLREVRPGEMLILSLNESPESIQISEGNEKLDIFEFVYFARPDSILYGERVSEVRRRFGQELANEHAEAIPENAVVVPVPDTSIPASEGFAEALGLRTRQAIVKDRYIGRTFILPNQIGREKELNIKHNIIPEAIVGKDVVLIDDSIVRLNTIPKIVKKVQDAGAKSVIVLIASPPVRFPDYYGMDTPSQDELAAANMTPKEMCIQINAEYLGFLSLSRLVRATNNDENRFNLSHFNGEYPVNIGNKIKALIKPVSLEYIDL